MPRASSIAAQSGWCDVIYLVLINNVAKEGEACLNKVSDREERLPSSRLAEAPESGLESCVHEALLKQLGIAAL